jgi:hypothetical protein
VGTAGTAAHFVSVMSESGVDVDATARLARHFSFRTTETIYRHELRTVITTGTDVMDGYAFSRALPYAVYNRISTLSYLRFRRKSAVFGLFTLSIELKCVYPH